MSSELTRSAPGRGRADHQILMIDDLVELLQQIVGLLAEAVDVLVADGRGIDAIDNDVEPVLPDELSQAGTLVNVITAKEV